MNLLKITSLSLLAAGAAQGTVVFSTDFTTIPAEVALSNYVQTPILTVDPEPGGHAFLDVTGVGASGQWAVIDTAGTQTITVTLSSLPLHTALSVDFFAAVLGGMDGIGAGGDDILDVSVDGTSVFSEGFRGRVIGANTGYDQTAPAGALLSAFATDNTDGADFLTGFNGGGWNHDSLYDLGVDPRLNDIAHTASTATIVITTNTTEPIGDEGWAIANLSVSAVPEPSSALLALLSGAALIGLRRRS